MVRGRLRHQLHAHSKTILTPITTRYAPITATSNSNSVPDLHSSPTAKRRTTFQAGFPAPNRHHHSRATASSVLRLSTRTYTVIPKDYHNPYVESWNVAVQQCFAAAVHHAGGLRRQPWRSHRLVRKISIFPPALGLGTAGEPEYIAFKRSAATTVNFLGFSSNYQSLQVAAEPPLRQEPRCDHLIHLGEGPRLPNRRRWRSLLLDRSASQLCAQRFRSPAQLRGELDL